MMKREFKCKYCGKIFSDPIPHKCVGGFRKHHLNFINLHPTNKEQIRDLKKGLGIPQNLNTFELIDWLADNYKLFITIVPARKEDGGWMENVIDMSTEGRSDVITQDFGKYTKYEQAIEASILEALSFLSLRKENER